MDRALDRDLLGRALGGYASLPTADELADLLATAEVGLLADQRVMPDDLLATGWYLHAAGSARAAVTLYGVQGQRAAFQVAGHIFDLALRMHAPAAAATRVDRLRLCFAAQIAYLRGALDPNAVALYAREGRRDAEHRFAAESPVDGEHDLALEFDTLALRAGVALLGMDLRTARRLGDQVASFGRDLVTAWGVGRLRDTMFGAAAGVAVGARELAVFLLYGSDTALTRGRAALLGALEAPAAIGDRTSRWVAAHLLDVSDGLEITSLWRALPPAVPAGVRRAFSLAHPPVLSLWPPQIELLGVRAAIESVPAADVTLPEAPGFRASAGSTSTTDAPDGMSTAALGNLTPLSPDARRVFMSTPTSGGKTLLSQLIVATHIGTQQTGVCIVAPTRSLCSEIRTQLSRRLRGMRASVVADLPAWALPSDAELLDDPVVEVMTPERLAYLLRTDPGGTLARFGLFVFDEVHNVGEPGRGWTLEAALSYVHRATVQTPHRIVVMSAVVGNRFHFVEWLGDGDADRVVAHHSDWRGPRRLHCLWTTAPRWNQPEPVTDRRSRASPLVRYPLDGVLHTRAGRSGDVRRLTTSEPAGVLVLRPPPEGTAGRGTRHDSSTPAYRTLVPLVDVLARGGPVLVIEATRYQTLQTARALATARSSNGTASAAGVRALLDIVEARLGADHPLATTIRQGVAYHHGSLPAEVRAAVEDAVTDGLLDVLVATTTMTEGVNLPVRAVVISTRGVHRAGGTYDEYIVGPKLINAIGRAGRATKETEGIVVLASRDRVDPQVFDALDPEHADLTATSNIATEAALASLAKFEDAMRASEDSVFESTDAILAGFLSFVWFAAAELERLEELVTETAVAEAFRHTLAWRQLSDADRTRWATVSATATRAYQRTDANARRRWATSGTSLRSARILDQLAAEVRLELADAPVPDPSIALLFLLDPVRMNRYLSLAEAPTRRVYTRRSGRRAEVPVDIAALIDQWVGGVELRDLAGRHLAAVPDAEYRFEQLGDVLNDYAEVFLPWVVGTVVTWVNEGRAAGGDADLLPSELAAYVRYGVDTPAALDLMRRGVRSRRLARVVAGAWAGDGTAQLQRVWEWVGSLAVDEWRFRFDATVPDLRNLLDVSRRRRGVTADILAGDVASLQVARAARTSVGIDAFDESTPQPAVLWAAGDSELTELEVRVAGVRVGVIPTHAQGDVHALLRAGLELRAEVERNGDVLTLHLQLIEPVASHQP